MNSEPRKWSWVEFILGWINKQFLIWCVSTFLVFVSILALNFVSHTCEVCGHIQNGISEKIQFTLVVGWIVISFCLFFYRALHILIENGKLNVDLQAKAGLSKEIKESK